MKVRINWLPRYYLGNNGDLMFAVLRKELSPSKSPGLCAGEIVNITYVYLLLVKFFGILTLPLR